MLLAPFKKSASVRGAKKPTVAKSNSSVGFNLKKRLLKLGSNSGHKENGESGDRDKLTKRMSNAE